MRMLSFLLAVFVFGGASLCDGRECDNGWFGSDCQFKCRCTENRCDDDGECIGDAQCEWGWFGPACQYVDLTVTHGAQRTPEWLRDGDDTTCNPDPTLQNVTLVLNNQFLFTWIRVRVNDPAILLQDALTTKIKMIFISIGWIYPREVARVDATTVDIHYDVPKFFSSVLFADPLVKALCSVYISGGRNVALRQETSQSSIRNSLSAPWHLVDGDINGNYTHGSCSATSSNGSDRNPSWTVTFSQPHLIYRSEFFDIKDGDQKRAFRQLDKSPYLKMSMFDEDGALLYFFTTTFYGQGNINNFPVMNAKNRDLGVSRISVQMTDQSPLSFCEIGIHGESRCEEGRYGRECEHTCNCAGNGTCFVSTGGCPSGCADGYTGENCQLDIDECASNNGGCDHTCMNFVGGFRCTCSNGYQLSVEDRRTCYSQFCAGADTEKLDDRCVRLVNERVKWQEAKVACEALGPTVSLVELTSNAVREYVQNMTVAIGSRAWLGATDAALEGQWVWSSTGNDSDIDPSWWGRGQPDNNNGNENCLIMRPDRLLNDYNCNFRLPYFCQSLK